MLKYFSQLVTSRKVGSTLIRDLLQQGKVDEVYHILGHYQISRTVVSGNKIGRSLDIPTANLQIRDDFADVLPVFMVSLWLFMINVT